LSLRKNRHIPSQERKLDCKARRPLGRVDVGTSMVKYSKMLEVRSIPHWVGLALAFLPRIPLSTNHLTAHGISQRGHNME
jgi:hypothetical protein